MTRMCILWLLLCLTAGQLRAADATPSYDDMLAKARKLMDDGKLPEAYLSASAAISLDDKRWEAYALVGLVLNAQGANADAKAYVDKALDRAPANKKASLQNIEKKISQSSSNSVPIASGGELTGDARRKLDVLMLVAEDADKAKTSQERLKLLREYLDKSEDFVRSNPNELNVWLIRAASAVELGESKIGWEAGEKLKSLGADNSNDAKARKVMAMLERKNWLTELQPAPETPIISDQLQQAITAVQDAFGKVGHFEKKTRAEPPDDFLTVSKYEIKALISLPTITFTKKLEFAEDRPNGQSGEMNLCTCICNLADLDPSLTSVRKADVVDNGTIYYYVEFYTHNHWSVVQVARSHTTFMSYLVYDLGFCDENDAKLVSEAVNHLIQVAQAEGWKSTVYANGSAAPKDDAEAAKWFRKTAEQGNALNQYNLGLCYANGTGVPKDEAEAVKWYLKAAKQGIVFAEENLGLCYANGTGVSKDEAEAVKWYLKAAEHGRALAQNNLGWCYAKGSGVPKDEAEAVKWYLKAAKQEHALAQENLGWCYYNGTGVPKDDVEAVKWFRKAAEQGKIESQRALGEFTLNGVGMPKDDVEAAKWFRKAAEQGDAYAQSDLGGCYYNGNGVSKDVAEAANWFRKAAEQGNIQGRRVLGELYANGVGVSKDETEAVKWLRKAAEQGDAYAQNDLGRCYYNGTGVSKDEAEAVKWYRKAAAQGNMAAQSALNALEKSAK